MNKPLKPVDLNFIYGRNAKVTLNKARGSLFVYKKLKLSQAYPCPNNVVQHIAGDHRPVKANKCPRSIEDCFCCDWCKDRCNGSEK